MYTDLHQAEGYLGNISSKNTFLMTRPRFILKKDDSIVFNVYLKKLIV